MLKKTLAFLLPLVFFSCEGPVGPQGPAGQDGNANVKAYVFNNLNWVVQNGRASVIGQLPALNSDILTSGAVLTYASIVQPNGAEVQWLLPYTVLEATYQENIAMFYGSGEWFLLNSASDDLPELYQTIPKIKIVVIQGMSGKKPILDPKLSWEDLVDRYPNIETITVN
jgi:hypothetical protein